MNTFQILAKLADECAKTPAFSSWGAALRSGVMRIDVTDQSDILAVAEDIAERAGAHIPCGLCGGNVRDHDWVGWVELDYGPDLATHGWDRFCPSCYLQLIADIPPDGMDWPEGVWPAILFATRCWPKTRGSIAYNNPPYHLRSCGGLDW